MLRNQAPFEHGRAAPRSYQPHIEDAAVLQREIWRSTNTVQVPGGPLYVREVLRTVFLTAFQQPSSNRGNSQVTDPLEDDTDAATKDVAVGRKHLVIMLRSRQDGWEVRWQTRPREHPRELEPSLVPETKTDTTTTERAMLEIDAALQCLDLYLAGLEATCLSCVDAVSGPVEHVNGSRRAMITGTFALLPIRTSKYEGMEMLAEQTRRVAPDGLP